MFKAYRQNFPMAFIVIATILAMSGVAMHGVSYREGLASKVLTGPQSLDVSAKHGLLRAYKYFPQAISCGTRWQAEYARLHNDIITGKMPPRFFISVSVEAGMADRITGMITQMFVAMLGNRAFTAVTYGGLPSFETTCQSPFINWTHPTILAEDVIAPLKTHHRGPRQYDPSTVDPKSFAPFFTINRDSQDPWQRDNMSSAPGDNSTEVPYVVSASNRGRSYTLVNNPSHKHHFWAMGINPNNAFMCGFFFLCTPTQIIIDQYRHIWDRLSTPDTLTIAVNVRMGDWVFTRKGYSGMTNQSILELPRVKGLFDCATRLEKAFEVPGRPVVWYLSSDSLYLRKAAAEVFGPKIITDTTRESVHVDCLTIDSGVGCEKRAMEMAMVHAIGDILTFCMAEYHVMRSDSGFGRVGAWLSGRWGNLYEISDGQSCDHANPTSPRASSRTWSGI